MLGAAVFSLLGYVRSFPNASSIPDLNDDRSPETLADHQIGYRHMPALGGRRPRQPGVDERLNAFWRVRSFHNYADYALGEAFREAFRRLVELGRSEEHTSELQSLMRISYAVFCLKKKKPNNTSATHNIKTLR